MFKLIIQGGKQMIKINNYVDQNDDIVVLERKGMFTIFEFVRDLSVYPWNAQTAYFMAKMGCRMRQLKVDINDDAIRLNPGAMKMMFGDVESQTGIKGVGDILGKAVKSKMTGDSVVKPVYKGTGIVITEPTFDHMLIEDLSEWNGEMVCDDGSFVACDDEVKDSVAMRSNFSSAVAGGEGLFNLCLKGSGYAVLKSPVPRAELVEIIMENDVVKIDGDNAIAWSNSLKFTVERSSKSLLGSAVNGEGLVNVYRGTGKLLIAPLTKEEARFSGTGFIKT